MYGRELAASTLALKPGDAFDIIGPSSFTANEALAVKFSQNIASGQHGGGLMHGVPSILVEVQAGARGIKAAALSPWKQAEIISAGKFAVVSVKEATRQVYSGGYWRDQREVRVTIKQTGTWKKP